MNRLPLFLAATAMALGPAACMSASGTKPPELSQEQVCLQHFEHDPAQRARCTVDAAARSDTPPDVRPLDLPVRNGQLGD
jgi:hypothetical protein